MRTLRLQSPMMTGSDVSSWQHFLVVKGLYRGIVDGIYGPASVQGTRDYQSANGLTADGVAGVGTFSHALHDGFESNMSPGMDAYADCAAFASCIAGAGMKFIVRYYSRFAAKSITRREAAALSKADLQVAVVYEDSNDSVDFFSTTLGQQNAAQALGLAAEIAQPFGSAIYFAVDFDPNASQVLGPISDYFRMLCQTLSTRYVVGVYGSGLTCRLIRDAGLAMFTWLSGSTEFQESAAFLPQANLIQVSPERSICDGKLKIDDDIAQSENFGGFRIT